MDIQNGPRIVKLKAGAVSVWNRMVVGHPWYGALRFIYEIDRKTVK